jgi:glycosyltransferase involved in cell wall biosynthesis
MDNFLIKNMNFLALTMMVKDESVSIKKSMDSVVDIVDSIIIYDTGSTDDTIEIIKKWASQNNKPLSLKQGEFCDFSTSRNILLEFAENIENPPEYLLLLDSNDELKKQNELLTFIKTNPATGYLLQQSWSVHGKCHNYWNIRLIKNKSLWRYTGRVHEYIETKTPNEKVIRVPEECILYQDRLVDGQKSFARFKRDVILLLEDHLNNPTEPRTCFYLAQSYDCLGDTENAYKYYKIRTKLKGFYEEVFYSYLKMATMSKSWEDKFTACIKAYEIIPRVEPLIIITEHYLALRNFHMAFLFIFTAYSLEYPTSCGLFINCDDYEYKRYHLMGLIAWSVGKKELGTEACLKAISVRNQDIDKHNLKFYL